MGHQSESFLNGEGDAWYERNRTAIDEVLHEAQDVNFILQTLKGSAFIIQDILEVGSSSARKLNALSLGFKARGAGIEPSSLAIKEASKRYPQLELHVGLASKLPFEANSFDLVFFGFCLYLVPQDEIDLAISESLRVLRQKGFIAITDFDPGVEMSVPYKHLNGLLSYKRNYTELLGKFSNVILIAKHSFSHSGNFFVIDRNERLSTQIYFVEK